jgi:dTDP-4-dehydrorhamnose reductase
MLGQDLMGHLAARHEALALDLPQTDITDLAGVLGFFKTATPEAVIHTAAFTAVDECERRPDLALQVNSEGTRNVALACRQDHIPMLYISTDYVFDGGKSVPYLEEDTPNPISVYGRSKLGGEKHVQEIVERYWIVRTSWLFGPKGKNFVRTILEKARCGESLRVVDDQVGAPTYTMDLAEKLEHIVEHGGPGVYHVTNRGYCSWFEFAQEILRQGALSDVRVIPIPTSASDRPAKRPQNSRLANSRLETEGLGLLPLWHDALHRYLLREGQAKG